ncbi:YCF48-related protein [Alicyclobacillus sp. SO9]|uniref:WD40/YVTN/BNR-like repeat-containing protein n=1 Tax=Alicyclobacillus sp. SO9 TaxID=2665646 RepID=UPI0018E8C8BD|nr:YCF48-related protein [Alicyclobacillus sp. SO9]QQE79521.1 hypothetical protein GI364_03230 [Alicyclobacillus sp. SO9]
MKTHKLLLTASMTLAMMISLTGCSGAIENTGMSTNENTTNGVKSNMTKISQTPGSNSTTSDQNSTVPPLASLQMIDSNMGWATGPKRRVWVTADGGKKWGNVTPKGFSASSSTVVRVFGLDAKHAWVAVTNDSSVDNPVAIFHTSSGGKSWSKQQFSDVGDPITLHFRNSREGWIALMQGAAAGSESETIYDTNNGGTTWSKVGFVNLHGGPLPFYGDKTGASFINKDHGWATGFTSANGHIYLYQTTDGGKTWTLQQVTVPSQLKNTEITSYPPMFYNQQEGILPVSDGSTLTAYRTTDGGRTWAPGKVVQSSVANQEITAPSFPTFNDGFATDGEKFFKTTDGGQTWSSLTPNVSLRNISELEFTSSTNGWALMNTRVLYHTTDGGHIWIKR